MAGVQYSGYASLEAGVRGSHTASTSISGIPSTGEDRRTELVGPLERRYRFEQTIPADELVWTPCGAGHDVNIATRLALTKTQNRGAGYLSLALAYAPGDEIAWQIAARPCSVPERDADTLRNAATAGADAASAP